MWKLIVYIGSERDAIVKLDNIVFFTCLNNEIV